MGKVNTPLFDIGANLLDKQLSKNFAEIISNSKNNNIHKIIITASHIEDTYNAKMIDQEPDLLYTTVGFTHTMLSIIIMIISKA